MAKSNGKTLVIVESPSKAKKIQHYLGADYQVVASLGHLFDLSQEGKYNLGVDVAAGFKPKYKLMPDKKDTLKIITDAAKQCDAIYLAADPDREGEAIAHHIGNALQSLNKPMKRVEFHEISAKGIRDGIANYRDIDENLFNSQQARRVLDRIVGFMVSPYLSKAFSKDLPDDVKLSAGRVQSVALRILTDREDEIEAFVPEIYWTIEAAVTDGDENFTIKLDHNVHSEKELEETLSKIKDQPLIVKSVDSRDKAVKPPAPFTTATLLQTAAKRLKMTAARATKAAQALYESGYITYMRTDSTRCSDESIAEAREYLKKNKRSIPDKPLQYDNKDGQNAHEAVRPTQMSLEPSDLSEGDGRILYQLIWKRMLASQSIDAVYATIKVLISAGEKTFVLNGKTLKVKGWKEFDKEDEKDILIPSLLEKQILTLINPGVTSEKKHTQPPGRFKEHSLIEELEKRGVGRPSTYSAIMSKISDRQYALKDKEIFRPTALGRKIINSLKKHFLFMKIEYTAQMEARLDKIADGSLLYETMLEDFYLPFQKELILAQSTMEPDFGHLCDKCGKPMKLRHGAYGYYLSCVDFLDCKNSKSCELVNNKPVIREFAFSKRLVEGTECPKCKSQMIKRDGKYGPFYSCSKYPKCSGSMKIPFGKKCGTCKEGDLFVNYLDGELKLNCMRYPDCKHSEDLPPDAEVEWIAPKSLGPREPPKGMMKNFIKKVDK